MPRDRLFRGVDWCCSGAAACRRRWQRHRCRCDGVQRTAWSGRLRRRGQAGSGRAHPGHAAGHASTRHRPA